MDLSRFDDESVCFREDHLRIAWPVPTDIAKPFQKIMDGIFGCLFLAHEDEVPVEEANQIFLILKLVLVQPQPGSRSARSHEYSCA